MGDEGKEIRRESRGADESRGGMRGKGRSGGAIGGRWGTLPYAGV